MSIIKRIISSVVQPATKMALIVRSDIKMTKGKAAAQCSHAAVLCYEKSIATKPGMLRNWCFSGQPKIVLKCGSYEDMLKIAEMARNSEITAEIVHDAGRTQLEAGTATVLGLGPDEAEKIDKVVAHLKLL